MKESLLSIVIPIYNGKKRIARCLESVLQQSYKTLEVILIDDGSSDGSYEYVQQFVKDNNINSFIIKMFQNENQGAAATRNFGISQASGEWVTFIDQDDYIEEDYCKNYMDYVCNSDVDIVVGGYERVSETGESIRVVSLKGECWDPFMVVAPWAHLYRLSFLRDNNISFLSTYIGEDVYYNLIAYACTKKIGVLIDNIQYKWVFNKESVSNSRQNKVSKKNNPIFLLDTIHDFYNKIDGQNCIDKEKREYYFTRYIIWYELFTVKGSNRAEYRDRINELFSWLEKEYPKYMKNPYIRRRIKGEDRMIYLSVVVMLTLRRFHLDLPVLSLLTSRK